MDFSGFMKPSQNSRINCMLPVISIPPSPSPDKCIKKHLWAIEVVRGNGRQIAMQENTNK